MQIEQIKPPSAQGKRYTLILEDGSRLRVREAQMIDFALHSEMELSDELLADLQASAASTALRERTANILSRRPYSREELRLRLRERSEDEDGIEDSIDWAEEIGLLCEETYAKSIVRHYAAKGYGPYKIRDELYRRRIPKALWEEALSELPETEAAIDAYLSRHLRDYEQKSIKKASDALARRGFSWSDISEGLRRARLAEIDY